MKINKCDWEKRGLVWPPCCHTPSSSCFHRLQREKFTTNHDERHSHSKYTKSFWEYRCWYSFLEYKSEYEPHEGEANAGSYQGYMLVRKFMWESAEKPYTRIHRNNHERCSDSTTKCQSFKRHKCWNDEKSTTSTNHSSDSTNHSSFKCCDEMFFPPNDTGTFLKMIYFSLAYYGTSRSEHNQSKEEQYECSFFNKSDMIRNTFDEEMTREIGSEKRWYSKYDHFVPKNLWVFDFCECSNKSCTTNNDKAIVGGFERVDMKEIHQYRYGEDRSSSSDESDHHTHDDHREERENHRYGGITCIFVGVIQDQWQNARQKFARRSHHLWRESV